VQFQIIDDPTVYTYSNSAPSDWVQFQIVDAPLEPHTDSAPSGWVQFQIVDDPTEYEYSDSAPSAWVQFQIIDDPAFQGSGVYVVDDAGNLVEVTLVY
jgi:hypothetical protein